MQPNVEELKRLVAALEGRGCHIVLFELPSAPGIRKTEYVKAAHILAKEAFPSVEKWLAISDDRSELRWVDASHMDERSAIIVTQQIDRYLALVARYAAVSKSRRFNLSRLSPYQVVVFLIH